MTRLLTGARPTGKMHLGHYVGALKNQVALQANYDEVFYIISDIHMLTTKSDKKHIDSIYRNAIDMVIDCIGMGMNPRKTVFYLQSNIPEQNNLFCLIQNLTYVQRIESTPSLREMSKHSGENVTLGLLAYPFLEAADIIGIGADMVPVGKDNIDHVLVTQEIIETFNQKYGTHHKLPAYITSQCNHVIGIDGQNKMSKSLNNAINIRDDKQTVYDKVQKMVWKQRGDGINVVIEYINIFCPKNIEYDSIMDKYNNNENVEKEARQFLYINLEELLEPMRERMKPYIDSPEKIIKLLTNGTQHARDIVKETYHKMRNEMGMIDL